MPVFYSAGGTEQALGMGSMLIPLLIMVALMYFLMIRPENKRKKEAEADGFAWSWPSGRFPPTTAILPRRRRARKRMSPLRSRTVPAKKRRETE